jgi:uncharacterized protein YukE
MAGLIRVTPEQLAGVSAQLNGGAGSIEATLSQLASQVAWQTSSRQLHQALADISILMRQASVAYETNDTQIGASFG